MKGDPLLIELFWVTRPYVRRADAVGHSARRLSRGIPYPLWQHDLEVVLDKIWKVSPFTGLYTSSLRAQGASIHLQRLLKERGIAA